jgi:hypothetical protein
MSTIYFEIITLLINLIFLILLVVLYNYIKKRSEINATKKDIDILTGKVESVKFEYLKRIEEYKNDLNLKYELEKTLVNSKVQAYKQATHIKQIILRRKSNMGSEKELMEKFFNEIPELLIHLESHYQLKQEFNDEILRIANYHNNVVNYLKLLKESGETKYNIDLQELEELIEKIQFKILN